LLDLKHQGIVVSRRGKQGGYLLLKPADMITFGEVLRIIDGPIAPLPCLSITAYRKCDDCDGEQNCEIRSGCDTCHSPRLCSTTLAYPQGAVIY
jgi:DNA-binding IscR family transcriptional regulator